MFLLMSLFPMLAPICTSVQLPFIYLNLFTILVPSSRFICRSQVSYHIFVYYFITRTRATGLASGVARQFCARGRTTKLAPLPGLFFHIFQKHRLGFWNINLIK